jgi:hypothetical protein
MIFYRDMNENLHCFDSNFFDNQRNSDHLLRIATDIAAAGYLGVVIHAEPLAAGEHFVGINYKLDTPEGAIFGTIRSDFDEGRPLPQPKSVLQRIRRAYRRQAKT